MSVRRGVVPLARFAVGVRVVFVATSSATPGRVALVVVAAVVVRTVHVFVARSVFFSRRGTLALALDAIAEVRADVRVGMMLAVVVAFLVGAAVLHPFVAAVAAVRASFERRRWRGGGCGAVEWGRRRARGGERALAGFSLVSHHIDVTVEDIRARGGGVRASAPRMVAGGLGARSVRSGDTRGKGRRRGGRDDAPRRSRAPRGRR